jgi:excisionase family DNA binding protein
MSTAPIRTHLLTVEEAAERLGTSVRFIRRLRAERRLPFIKIGRHLRVDSGDLEAFVSAGREELPS